MENYTMTMTAWTPSFGMSTLGRPCAHSRAFGAGAAVSQSLAPQPNEVRYNIPPRADGSVNPDPFLAGGVSTGKNVAVYTASGTGPAALNTAAPAGSPTAPTRPRRRRTTLCANPAPMTDEART